MTNEIAVAEKIEGTSLWVVAVVYHRHQTSLHRCEAGENITVYRVRDEVSGEVGHLSYAQAWDKRSINYEEFRTDNIKLFEKNHPEGDWYCFGELPQGEDPVGSVEPVLPVVLRYSPNGGWCV